VEVSHLKKLLFPARVSQKQTYPIASYPAISETKNGKTKKVIVIHFLNRNQQLEHAHYPCVTTLWQYQEGRRQSL
jgi:hypothetical protein